MTFGIPSAEYAILWFTAGSLIFCPLAWLLVALSESKHERTLRIIAGVIVAVLLASATISAAQLPNIDWCTRVDGWIWWVNLCFLA